MFRFYFALKNPFKRSRIEQTDYIMYDRKITTNKSGEDHGGIGFDIEVLGYMFAAKIYDIRHWDYKNHCWEEYDEVHT